MAEAAFASGDTQMEDDAACAIRGTQEKRDLYVTMVCVTWLALGLPLAFRKAKRSNYMTWIGHTMSINRENAVASVKAEKAEDLLQLINEIEKSNIITLKDLRT